MALLFCPFLCVFILGGGGGVGKLIERGEKMFNLFHPLQWQRSNEYTWR